MTLVLRISAGPFEMKTYTVAKLAKLAGVSVRTLHHYDAVGLLKPAHIGRNGYRHYGADELLRLQQILIHRSLGMSLAEIGALLDAPDFDRLTSLTRQRDRMAAEAERHAAMVRTIDRTIEMLRGARTMTDGDLYSGLIPQKQTEYEGWLIERYGGDMPERIDASRRKYEALSEQDRAALMDELRAIESDWVEAMLRGVSAESEALDPLLRRHRRWVATMWAKDCPPAAYAGLADLHVGHPDFVGRYESLGEGFSTYHASSMKAHAARCG